MPLERGQNAADAHSLVGHPGQLFGAHGWLPQLVTHRQRAALIVHFLDPGMVQSNHLPLIVENRRSGRARLGVCLVVNEVIDEADDRVFAQRHLLGIALRVLDHGDILLEQGLA